MFFGWGFENDDRKISSFNPDVWPIEDIINGLNELVDLDDKGLADIICYSKNKNLDFITLKQSNKSKVAIVTGGEGYTSVCNAVEALPVALNFYEKD